MHWSGWVDLFVVRHEVGVLFQLPLVHVCIQLFKTLFYLMRKVFPLRGFTMFAWCQLLRRINYLYGQYFICLDVMHPLLNLLLLWFILMLVKILFFPEFLPQLMQLLLYFFHSILIPLPSRDSLVALLPLCLNSHSFLFYKWIYLKLVAFLLHVVDNLPLPFFMHKYAWLCYLCCCYCRCSPSCCFILLC